MSGGNGGFSKNRNRKRGGFRNSVNTHSVNNRPENKLMLQKLFQQCFFRTKYETNSLEALWKVSVTILLNARKFFLLQSRLQMSLSLDGNWIGI